jgi:hypothetical protein
MTTAVVLLAAGLAVLIALVVRNWLRWRGARLITCPETQLPAGVRVDARHAALKSLSGPPELRLADCSRWPEKRNCGQECLKQIERSPEGCLVRYILAQWYADKECSRCGKPLGNIDWLERKPAVMAPGGKTLEWQEVPTERLADVLASHRPVCWNCHIVETFRREHPELVVERPR